MPLTEARTVTTVGEGVYVAPTVATVRVYVTETVGEKLLCAVTTVRVIVTVGVYDTEPVGEKLLPAVATVGVTVPLKDAPTVAYVFETVGEKLPPAVIIVGVTVTVKMMLGEVKPEAVA